MLSETFNMPRFSITPNDWPYIVVYRVYHNSPIQSSWIYADSEEHAVKQFNDWLGEHWSIYAIKANFSKWDLHDEGDDYHMLCSGLKHENKPLFSYWKS